MTSHRLRGIFGGLPTKIVSATNGVAYAYRDTGGDGVPLVLLQHFRGNLDNWDPALVDALASARRVVLASSAPQGQAGLHGWAPDVIDAIGTPSTSPDAYLGVFFTRSAARQAGAEALKRMYARTKDRDMAATWATREAQYDAVCSWGSPITRCSSGWVRSACRCSWLTATATR